ncbi:MAG: hypothetical protein C1943_09495 [Halochromatium sp.]|nr:hypothetical protein [Halochromatium sp.]
MSWLGTAGLAMGLCLPGAAFAYGESDAIRDCNSRMRADYSLSDFRSESAEKLPGGGHRYKVVGKTKIDGKKHSYSCEIKDRRVVAVNYDGPEPEGLGTAEKLAIGAAAAIAAGVAASAMSKDKEPEPAPPAAPAPEVKVRSNGNMEVAVAGGCTVLYNDIGLRESVSSRCTDADVAAAKRAMNQYLAKQSSSR